MYEEMFNSNIDIPKLNNLKPRPKLQTPAKKRINEIYETFSTKQKEVFDIAMSCKENMFITGGGGVGKSYLLKTIVDALRNVEKKQVIVCAPTGVAAQNIDGVTIHRQFGFPIEVCLNKKQTRPLARANKVLKMCDILVLDEVSMCRIDIFDSICLSVQKANNYRISMNLKPIKIYIFGDFYQLPPVITDNDRKILETYYNKKNHSISGKLGNGYAFNSIFWKTLNLYTVKLDEVIRQKDPEFINHLNKIREGEKGFTNFFNHNTAEEKIENAISLYAYNRDVNIENNNQLDKIEGTKYTFTAQLSGRATKEDCRNDYELNLKVGSKIMIIINDSPNPLNDVVRDRAEAYQGKILFVNGSLAIVREVHPDWSDPDNDYITIELLESKRIINIKRYTFSIDVYEEKNGQIIKKKIGSISQFPIRLAFACSIHKSQGLSFDRLNLDPDTFLPHQLYVGLSRVTNLQGLHLSEFVREDFLSIDDEVFNFYNVSTRKPTCL